MKIYETLKSVLTEEQLSDFQKEVRATVDEAVEKKTAELSNLSEEYVNKAIEEKESELKAAYEKKLEEKTAALEAERDGKVEELTEEYKRQIEEELVAEGVVTKEKFEEFRRDFYEREDQLVESLNKFLDERIEEKIPKKLIKESVVSQELMGLVNGIKMLFEEHYSGIDSTAGIKKVRQENKELKEAYERLIREKAEISERAEQAATRLLISEKTKNLSEKQAKKVMTYFEGRDFDFVKDRIDDFVTLTEDEEAISERKQLRSERRLQRLDEANGGFIPERRPNTESSSFFDKVSEYL